MRIELVAICPYSLAFLEKLSEKGSEQGFDCSFGQYTNAKTARGAHLDGP